MPDQLVLTNSHHVPTVTVVKYLAFLRGNNTAVSTVLVH